MTAEAIADALGGRKTSRGWRALCPAHDDRHPSLDIEERNGKTLLVCRSGCANREVIAALRDRGLWAASSPSSTSTPPFKWIDNVPAEAPAISDCCLELP